MIALLQRVSRAEVEIEGETLVAIDRGVLALVCAEPGDDESTADRMLERLLGYRAATPLGEILDVVIPWVRQQVEYGNI